ncbi:MAG: hypothetical protein JWR30_3159 [Conexibacter sp.]|jgi:hypothetical protein|nr:hypothetical protein [Conexibacter sp.]MCZ4495312.1 hypothetical protein [Conexibacter sp.]MDX6730982.1 hypothetical protein [Baekduia sp.]
MTLSQIARRAVTKAGIDVLPRKYWSPIPYDVPEPVWTRRSSLTGIDFDVDSQVALFERIAPHTEGWTRPDPKRMYGGMDAVVLYGMLRELQPAQVIELGSGVSTDIIREALGRPHRVFDPYANDRTDLAVEPTSAVDVPLPVFQELAAGDVLFVDTSHTVKTGGDVTRIVLDVLPVLAPGVIVHVHDIFLPFEYPREWVEQLQLYWAEQYLLQAFLIGNPDWEILLGCAAVQDAAPELVERYAPGHGPHSRPGAFWMRRR